MIKISNQERGVAALMTMVIVSAAALIMAAGASVLGLGDLESGYQLQQGGEALAATEGCIEESLHRIRLDTNFGIGMGSMPLTLTNGSCTIEVTDSGSDRTIVVVGMVGDYSKKVQVDLTLTGDVITLNNWEERDD